MLDQPDKARRYARSSFKYFDARRRAVGYGDWGESCFLPEPSRKERPVPTRVAGTGPAERTLARAAGPALNLLFTRDPNRRRMAPIGMGVQVTIALWMALASGGDIPGVTTL